MVVWSHTYATVSSVYLPLRHENDAHKYNTGIEKKSNDIK